VVVVVLLRGLPAPAPRGAPAPQRRPAEAAPLKSKRKRSREPKPFAGLTQKPHCALCEQQVAYLSPADNSHGSLLGRLKGAHQPVIKPRNRCSASRSSLLAGLYNNRFFSTSRF